MYNIDNVNLALEVYSAELLSYCQYLADMYNETNEGKYRIKYNVLYPLLFNNLSDNKKVEFFNSFILHMNCDYNNQLTNLLSSLCF